MCLTKYFVPRHLMPRYQHFSDTLVRSTALQKSVGCGAGVKAQVLSDARHSAPVSAPPPEMKRRLARTAPVAGGCLSVGLSAWWRGCTTKYIYNLFLRRNPPEPMRVTKKLPLDSVPDGWAGVWRRVHGCGAPAEWVDVHWRMLHNSVSAPPTGAL